MSAEAMEWVWEHARARGVARMVLLVIAYRAPDADCAAYAGTTMLVRRTGAARSTVRAAVDRLVASGELEIIDGVRGPRDEVCYRLPHAAAHLRAMSEARRFGGPETEGPESGPVQNPAPRKPAPWGSESSPEGAEDRPGTGPETGPPKQIAVIDEELSSASAHVPEAPPASSDRIPEQARPLVDALRRERVSVTWKLAPGEWALVLAAVQQWGAEEMVRVAVERTAGRAIRSARYLLAIWRDPANFTPAPPQPAQDAAGGGKVVPLRRAPGSYTDNLLAGLALLEERGEAR